jgi:small subunit ribosomal protein S1
VGVAASRTGGGSGLTLDQKLNIVYWTSTKPRSAFRWLKQLTPHPWDSLPADLQPGSKVSGRIVNVADYGAFMEVVPGVEGLIHVSEMSWSQHLRNPQDFIKQGDTVEAQILTLDREDRKMSLGIKQLTEDPVDAWRLRRQVRRGHQAQRPRAQPDQLRPVR